MAKKKKKEKSIDWGSVAKMGAIVAGVGGGAVALSSNYTSQRIFSAWNAYGDAYGMGEGFKGVAMRMAPGLIMTGLGVALTSGDAEMATAVGGLGLGGTLIGSLAPVVQTQVGDRISQALGEGSWFGGPVESLGVGGPRRRPQLSSGGGSLAARVQNVRRAMGGPIAGLAVGGAVEGLAVGGGSAPNATGNLAVYQF